MKKYLNTDDNIIFLMQISIIMLKIIAFEHNYRKKKI